MAMTFIALDQSMNNQIYGPHRKSMWQRDYCPIIWPIYATLA